MENFLPPSTAGAPGVVISATVGAFGFRLDTPFVFPHTHISIVVTSAYSTRLPAFANGSMVPKTVAFIAAHGFPGVGFQLENPVPAQVQLAGCCAIKADETMCRRLVPSAHQATRRHHTWYALQMFHGYGGGKIPYDLCFVMDLTCFTQVDRVAVYG